MNAITLGVLAVLFAADANAHPGPKQVLGEIERSLEQAPDNPELLFERAAALLEKGDLSGAMQDLERVEGALPGDPRVLLLRGLARKQAGDPNLAEADLTLFLDEVGSHYLALAARGKLRESDGRLQLAWQDYEAAAPLSKDPDLFLARSRVALGLGNQPLACEGYRQGWERLHGAVVLSLASDAAGCDALEIPNERKMARRSSGAQPLPPPMPAVLERWPYLQTTHPEGTTIVWRTDETSAGSVIYGAAPDALNTEIASSSIGPQHEVAITGLNPDTRYFYAVKVNGAVMAGGDENHTFQTAPIAGQDKKTRIWVVGDSGTGDTRQAEVRDAMLDFVGSDLPELYLHVGDMAYNSGTDSEFTDNFFAPYRNQLSRMTTWPAMGNHEGYTSDSADQSGPYYEGYVLPIGGEAGGVASGTEAYYSFDYGRLHVIVLDSYESSREPGDAMLTWLEADLAATNQDWIIASWHHPPYTKGTHDSDTEPRHIDMRENVMPILDAAGVDLVLGGHSHIYERSYLVDSAYETPSTSAGIVDGGDGDLAGDGGYQKPAIPGANQGTLHVVAGHGAKSTGGPGNHPLMAFTEYENGSVILDLHQNTLQITNIRYDGIVSDEVALIKGDALVVTSPDGGWVTPGEDHTVTWATVGNIPTVDVSWSCDDGATWIEIATGLANTGSISWAVPFIEADHGLVRVESSTDQATWDESNAGFQIGTPAVQQAVSFGDTWSYHDQDVDLGTSWRELGYDDSAWSAGPGQLGYGDGDESTLLLDASPNVPSAYFRRELTISDTVTAAELTVLYDDGVAVWVNGVEVLNENMDKGLDHSQWAGSTSSDNSLVVQEIDLSVNPFVEGSNVVAAMVKQVGASSSDLSFDLSLALTVSQEAAQLEACPVPEPVDTGLPDDTSQDTNPDSTAESMNDSQPAQDSGQNEDPDNPKEESGCQCASSARGAGWLPLALLGLTLFSRRKRTAPNNG